MSWNLNGSQYNIAKLLVRKSAVMSEFLGVRYRSTTAGLYYTRSTHIWRVLITFAARNSIFCINVAKLLVGVTNICKTYQNKTLEYN
jgi:hypothetical protein